MIVADLHMHTLVSNHAYNTITEMAAQAAKLGLSAIAITDHGVAMPDAPHPWYFGNITKEFPLVMEGIPVLKGVEANVMDTDGNLDFSEKELKAFDWVIASIHSPLLPGPISCDEANHLWSKIAENPWVDLIGHSELPQYAYDYDELTKLFARNHRIVELNANSCVVRPAGTANMKRLAQACAKNGTPVAVNSDAHSIYRIAQVENIFQMLKEIDFPQELIVNSSNQRLLDELKKHAHPTAKKLEGVLK